MGAGSRSRRGFLALGAAFVLLANRGGEAAGVPERRAVRGLTLSTEPRHRGSARAARPARGRRAAPKPLIVIDPGHGGHDPGAVGARGTREKAVALAVAKELRRLLRAAGRYRVALTRGSDAYVPLRARLGFAERSRAALIVSLHADSATGGVRGASVYTFRRRAPDATASCWAERRHAAGGRPMRTRAPPPPHQARPVVFPANLAGNVVAAGSERLARLAVAEMGRVAPLLAAPRREAGFAVLGAAGVPSVLVELGFLSHPGEEALLLRPAHRRRLPGALARAVDRWFAVVDTPPSAADGVGRHRNPSHVAGRRAVAAAGPGPEPVTARALLPNGDRGGWRCADVPS